MTTLDDAITHGQGIERAFNCMVHGDSIASASVNVVKGLWHCYACGASGSVDTKKAPSAEALAAMVKPEKTVRVYPQAYLELYDPLDVEGSYWGSRFVPWAIRAMRLGTDPFSGDATFPVRTAQGVLAGVGRRAMGTKEELKEAGIPRYRYPKGWSAASTLCAPTGSTLANDVVVLVEGAADTTALVEVGVPVFGCWGAGLHFPQRELLLRAAPKLVLAGFDMDEAGERAVTRLFAQMGKHAEVKRVRWSGSDPAEIEVGLRRQDLLRAVTRSHYAGNVIPAWTARTAAWRDAYDRSLEEDPWHHQPARSPVPSRRGS